MRTVYPWVAFALLLSGCTPVSIQPTYHENQLISVPGLDGVWRDSVEGNEIMLTRLDSVSYIMSMVEGEASRRATSDVTIRLARRSGVTFLDMVPTPANDSPRGESSTQPFLGWHAMTLHGFSLVDVTKDRIALRILDFDTLKAVLERSPREIAHVVSDERPVLTASTDQVQAFLIRTSLLPGKSATQVYHRVPGNSSCDDGSGEEISLGLNNSSDSRLLKTWGVQVHRTVDGAFATLRSQWTGAALAANGLFAAGDPALSQPSPAQLALSRDSPLVLVDDRRNERRLELRWNGVEPDGDVIVRAIDCYDEFPSSQMTREKLPPPDLQARTEGDPVTPLIRFAWKRVAGATTYELRRLGYDLDANGYLVTGPRFLVQDTTVVVPGSQYTTHWRIRAYAPGDGFGPISTVHYVQRPAPMGKRASGLVP